MDKPLWGLRVQAPLERSGSGAGSGPGPGWCLPVFPKGPAPAAQRGIWHPSGLWPSVPRVVYKGCIASLRGPPIGGQDRDGPSYRCSAPTPFPASRDFPSRGNEKIGVTGYCVTYDTDSQSRNASCVPFRGRGPQSGEGVDGGNPDYDTRCGRDCRRWPSGPWCQGLCRKVASLRSGGRRLAVRKTIEYQIGVLPRTPFPAAREFPSRGNEKDGEEKQRVIYFR